MEKPARMCNYHKTVPDCYKTCIWKDNEGLLNGSNCGEIKRREKGREVDKYGKPIGGGY